MSLRTLEEIYADHKGFVSDKWDIYLREYERIFSPLRQCSVRLLEIGVQNGGSLQIWEKYFPRAEAIIGCDANPDCERLTYASPQIKLILGDIGDADTRNEILATSPQFDIIIDDGSHTSRDIIQTFCQLFPYLSCGGLFIVEDLHCSYWHEYQGGLFCPTSSVAFFKALIDVVNHEHWGLSLERRSVLDAFDIPEVLCEEILAQIHSIEFVNSLCVVHKRSIEENSLGPRHVIGQTEDVFRVQHLHGTLNIAPKQKSEDVGCRPAIDSALKPAAQNGSKLNSAYEARLYWQESNESQYSQSRSVACTYIANSQRQCISIVFPTEFTSAEGLRLDIADAPLAMLLHGISIKNPNEEEIWIWDNSRTTLRRDAGIIFHDFSCKDFLIIFVSNDDPRFEFFLPESAAHALSPNCTLLLDITPCSFSTFFPALLSSISIGSTSEDENRSRISAEMKHTLSVLQSELNKRHRNILNQQASLRESDGALSVLLEQLLQAEDQLKLFNKAAE